MKHSVHVCVPTLQQPGVENRANTEKFGLDAQKYRQLPPPNPCISEMAFSHRFQKVYTYPPLRNKILVLWTKNGENPENTRICSALAYSECPRERERERDIYIYIYTHPLIYTPLPNSRWLHHTALRCVQRVQLGAYMWRKGLKLIKTGSKWAQNTCSCTPNGPGSLLEKRVSDPFFTHFCPQNCPFSRHFGIFHGPKPVPMGSKWAKNTCLSIPNGSGSLLEKRVFDPFLTLFWSQNDPFSRHCGIFHGPKRVTTGSKRPKNTCLSIPSGLGTTLEKIIFSAPGTLVDPPLAPAVRGPRCPPAVPNDH